MHTYSFAFLEILNMVTEEFEMGCIPFSCKFTSLIIECRIAYSAELPRFSKWLCKYDVYKCLQNKKQIYFILKVNLNNLHNEKNCVSKKRLSLKNIWVYTCIYISIIYISSIFFFNICYSNVLGQFISQNKLIRIFFIVFSIGYYYI